MYLAPFSKLLQIIGIFFFRQRGTSLRVNSEVDEIWRQETKNIVLSYCVNFDVFNHVGVVNECDGQTDRQTDRQNSL